MCCLLLSGLYMYLYVMKPGRKLLIQQYTCYIGVVPGPLAMPIIDRSMASSQRTLASVQSRRASSSQGCRGISVSASRAGAARTAAILLLSYHDTFTEVPYFSTKSRLGTGVFWRILNVAYLLCVMNYTWLICSLRLLSYLNCDWDI